MLLLLLFLVIGGSDGVHQPAPYQREPFCQCCHRRPPLSICMGHFFVCCCMCHLITVDAAKEKSLMHSSKLDQYFFLIVLLIFNNTDVVRAFLFGHAQFYWGLPTKLLNGTRLLLYMELDPTRIAGKQTRICYLLFCGLHLYCDVKSSESDDG